MKKLLVGLCAVFICTIAIAHNINWHVGNQIIQTTTCEIGENVIVPTAPEKYGYTFKEWKVSENLFDITALSNYEGYTIIDGDTFTSAGYPGAPVPLKELVPSLEKGDKIRITGTTNGANAIFFTGSGSVIQFGESLTITANILNGGIRFYCKTGSAGPATITNLQIIKIETPTE